MHCKCRLTAALLGVSVVLSACRTSPPPDTAVRDAFAGREGALVVIDCASGAVSNYRSPVAVERVAPCSTFKIWNALIGLESGLITAPEEAFYHWDGQVRAISDWNQDLTLEAAFRASCVPAFQALARQIGPERMQSWIERIGYGDGNIASGVDVFWLPTEGRKTLLISPLEQARLMQRLVAGTLPCSTATLGVVKQMMRLKETNRGTLYGKTGSGTNAEGTYVLGWFVGYVERGGATYVFACTVQGEHLMGRDARAIVAQEMERRGLL